MDLLMGLLMGLLFQRESPYCYTIIPIKKNQRESPWKSTRPVRPRCQQHQTLRRLRRPGREVVRRHTGLGRGRFFRRGKRGKFAMEPGENDGT